MKESIDVIGVKDCHVGFHLLLIRLILMFFVLSLLTIIPIW